MWTDETGFWERKFVFSVGLLSRDPKGLLWGLAIALAAAAGLSNIISLFAYDLISICLELYQYLTSGY